MGMPADYVDVAERIREFREKHPEGSLQQIAWGVQEVNGKHFIHYTAAAYRTPDDARPGIGTAWEPFPGPTNFTRDSELMNAETSAWGRAIIAAGAADAKRVASANEVANRQAAATANLDAIQAAFDAAPATTPTSAVGGDSGANADAYTFKFGKHKGKALTEVPGDYLDWLLRQPAKDGFEQQHAEAHAMYRRELARREAA
jgi:hypothetical protein